MDNSPAHQSYGLQGNRLFLGIPELQPATMRFSCASSRCPSVSTAALSAATTLRLVFHSSLPDGAFYSPDKAARSAFRRTTGAVWSRMKPPRITDSEV